MERTAAQILLGFHRGLCSAEDSPNKPDRASRRVLSSRGLSKRFHAKACNSFLISSQKCPNSQSITKHYEEFLIPFLSREATPAAGGSHQRFPKSANAHGTLPLAARRVLPQWRARGQCVFVCARGQCVCSCAHVFSVCVCVCVRVAPSRLALQ